MNSKRQRDRGRILTPNGLSRLQQAIRAWELEHEIRCTQEQIRELTSAVKAGGLDPGTIRKILKAKEGVDPESIRCLFTTFGLRLGEEDLVSSSRLQIQTDPNFVGREDAIGDLNTLINRGAKVIVIQARGGVGKTTLARKYLQQEFGSYLEFPIAKETKDIASIESLIEEKLRQLGEEPGREFFVSLDRLRRKLQEERIGILIDNLEPALDAAGKFIEPHRRYVELLRVLSDPAVQSITLITSRERLNEYSITTHHYPLRDLALTAWEKFFQNCFSLEGKAFGSKDSSALEALHKSYGGNAKAMDILCGTILTDYAGEIEVYWQANQEDLLIERALEDLVVGQFDRLQQTDPDAYNLLCRMGCYRYQDVPTVPVEGLFYLLWDVPKNRQRRIVKWLQDRSLVEFEDGKYWLHPVIRSEAIERLRTSDAWERANREAATFWTDSVKNIEVVVDVIQAFEAFYHYFEIQDLEQAGYVITYPRESKLEGSNHSPRLASSFYRLGLPQQMIAAINQIIDNIKPSYTLSKLFNLLGDQYWATGQIYKAIHCHQQSQEVANECLKSTSQNDCELTRALKGLEKLSTYNLGLCKIDIWELEQAEIYFKEFLSGEDFGLHCSRNASACLAFVKSCTGAQRQAHELAEKMRNSQMEAVSGSWNKALESLFLGLTYKNTGDFQTSLDLLQSSVLLSKSKGFSQAQARALNGLSEVSRIQRDYRIALQYHSNAIEILEKIDSQCDLAEAHYQLGLTYQAMEDLDKSSANFQRAIQLFTAIEAPKQVERIRRSMILRKNN